MKRKSVFFGYSILMAAKSQVRHCAFLRSMRTTPTYLSWPEILALWTSQMKSAVVLKIRGLNAKTLNVRFSFVQGLTKWVILRHQLFQLLLLRISRPGHAGSRPFSATRWSANIQGVEITNDGMFGIVYYHRSHF